MDTVRGNFPMATEPADDNPRADLGFFKQAKKYLAASEEHHVAGALFLMEALVATTPHSSPSAGFHAVSNAVSKARAGFKYSCCYIGRLPIVRQAVNCGLGDAIKLAQIRKYLKPWKLSPVPCALFLAQASLVAIRIRGGAERIKGFDALSEAVDQAAADANKYALGKVFEAAGKAVQDEWKDALLVGDKNKVYELVGPAVDDAFRNAGKKRRVCQGEYIARIKKADKCIL